MSLLHNAFALAFCLNDSISLIVQFPPEDLISASPTVPIYTCIDAVEGVFLSGRYADYWLGWAAVVG